MCSINPETVFELVKARTGVKKTGRVHSLMVRQ